MANEEAKKILRGRWASAAGALTIDPEDATLQPPVPRTLGYPQSFSDDDGNTIRLEVFNQRSLEWDSAATDSMRFGGPLPYDADINYHQWARCTVQADEYYATVANGPDLGNATDPTTTGQTVWLRAAGEVNLPAAPDAPAATHPESGELDWSWNCPLDGGSEITGFNFQWRVDGTQAWSASIVVTVPRYVLSGLTNGTAIEARVQAESAQGTSPWSNIGTATPQGQAPGGGSTLALRADPGDGEADLTWLEPDDGGDPITSYIYQWRADAQGFNTGRQGTATTNAATVSPLTNGTLYYFRVRAVNGQGNGPWSNEASATPAVMQAATAIPDVAVAPTAQAGNAEVTWIATPPSDNGADITSYEWRWRTQGAGAWTSVTTTLPVLTRDGLTNGTAYEAQVRAENSVGQQATRSPSGVGTPVAMVPDQVQFVGLENLSNGVQADWGAPEANGSAITGYQIDSADNAAFTGRTRATITATSRLLTGFADGDDVFVRVRAQNGQGNGAWSPTNASLYP